MKFATDISLHHIDPRNYTSEFLKPFLAVQTLLHCAIQTDGVSVAFRSTRACPEFQHWQAHCPGSVEISAPGRSTVLPCRRRKPLHVMRPSHEHGIRSGPGGRRYRCRLASAVERQQQPHAVSAQTADRAVSAQTADRAAEITRALTSAATVAGNSRDKT